MPTIENLSFTLDADVTGADSLTLDGETVTLPTTVTPSADHTYTLVATGPGGTAQASLTIDLQDPPPVPVDCVLSDWGPWQAAGEWSSCIKGLQARNETRARTIVTPPSNGGAACGPLTEDRIAEQACTVPTGPVYPAWRRNKVQFEVVKLGPQTVWSSRSRAHYPSIGLVPPSQLPAPHYISFGTNKLGQVCRPVNKDTTENYGYHGMAFDKRTSTLHVGTGDADYPENGYFGLTLEADDPLWAISVNGSHSRDYRVSRNPDGSNIVGGMSMDGGPYTRQSEHMDGRPRGGHMYWNQEVLIDYQGADRIVHWWSNQFYDTDSGSDRTIRTANLNTQTWDQGASAIIKPWYSDGDKQESDTRPWKQQHPITQDQYMIRGDRLWVWRFATNTYEIVYDFNPVYTGQWGMDDVGMSINWEENYILCQGGVLANHATSVKFILDLNQTEGTNKAKRIPITNIIGTGWGTGKYGAIVWCPDVHKFIQYRNDTDNRIYSIERTGNAEVTVAVVPTTGVALPALHVGGGALGGMLNKWRYVPNLHGIACMLQTRDPLYFLVTA